MNEIGRNDPCRCGSGKKYKKCHLGQDEKNDQRKRHRAALNASKVAGETSRAGGLFRRLAAKLPLGRRRAGAD